MASVTTIKLDHTKDVGVFSRGLTESAARAASDVLQMDMENHHVFFNDIGFHNHIVHHVLTVYALGGSVDDIWTAYNNNTSYQLPARPTDSLLVQSLHDKATFKDYLGKKEHYPNFLSLFQSELKSKGTEGVLKEYIFADNELANDMLSRLYGGLAHPLIHLGLGLEFNQPAIVAQALAQTAVHENSLGCGFFLPAEQRMKQNANPENKSILQLLNELRADKELHSAVKHSDGNKIFALLSRAPEHVLSIMKQYVVPENKLQESLAEMINICSYFTGAAQRPNKIVKLDFFILHTVTSSIFFSTYVNLPWLDQRSKARMLEWKARLDLLIYASYGFPDLLLNEVSEYPVTNDWEAVITQSCTHPSDDGHLSKLVRALAHGENVCRPFEQQMANSLPISGNMWLQIGNMAIDSTRGRNTDRNAAERMWVFESGFEESWKDLPPRTRL